MGKKNKFVDDGAEGIVIRDSSGKEKKPGGGKSDEKSEKDDGKGKKKSSLRAAAIRLAASRPAGDPLRETLLRVILADVEDSGEEEEEESKGKKRGPPPKWQEFLDAKYQGGKAKVQNTNPKTRAQRPEVVMTTRMKADKAFKSKVYDEYIEWIGKQKADKSSPKKEKTEEEKKEEKSELETDKSEKKPEKKEEPPKAKEPEKPKAKKPEFLPNSTSAFHTKGKALGVDREDWKEDEKSAVYAYTGGDYTDINNALRGGGMDEWVRKYVKGMDKLFNSPNGKLPEATMVLRATGKSNPLHQMLLDGSLKVGDTYEDKGYVSTTIQPPGAWDWGSGKVKMHIHVPKGAKAVYVGPPPSGYSQHSTEYEVILARESKMKVTGFDKSTMTVELEVVV
jgi:hypothetical protein